jgi:hypothetical protein
LSTILVEFSDAWLCDVANPAVTVHASFPERGSKSDLDGAVRFYAGGRRRVITTANRSATFPLTLQLLTDADLTLLESWAGRVLLLRDGASRREWVTFLSCEVEDLWDPEGTLHNVSLALSRIDFDESV